MKGLGMLRGRAGSCSRRERAGRSGCSCSSPAAVGPPFVLGAIQGKLCPSCSHAAPALCERVPQHSAPPLPHSWRAPRSQGPSGSLHVADITAGCHGNPGCPKHDPLAWSHVCQEMRVYGPSLQRAEGAGQELQPRHRLSPPATAAGPGLTAWFVSPELLLASELAAVGRNSPRRGSLLL